MCSFPNHPSSQQGVAPAPTTTTTQSNGDMLRAKRSSSFPMPSERARSTLASAPKALEACSSLSPTAQLSLPYSLIMPTSILKH
eukprot:3663787-Lingulodinium_polyedra.AAC.1